MKLPFDPNFPALTDDAPYFDRLKNEPIRPIFIMGLHRSGTTFLYDSIARCFPVANLSLYHLFFYNRLLKNFHEGNEQRDRDILNRLFRGLGITNRKIDNVWVDDRMVEEYGWLLRQRSYRVSVQSSNSAFLAEICRKLVHVTPGSQAALLKNPWDTGNAKQILQQFPNAKFIYITRKPTYILNSLINATLSLTSGSQPFQTLLVDDFKMPAGKLAMQVIYAGWAVVRGVRRLLGDRISTEIILPFAAFIVKNDLAAYYRDLAELPKESVFEVDYQKLNTQPKEIMGNLRDFLDLPFSCDPSEIVPKPRSGQIQERLLSYEPRFMQRLKRSLGDKISVD